MARIRRQNDEDTETSIDISPLIDCVFILLIFFIVTTTFIDEWGVAVDKPSAAPAQAQQEEDDKPKVVIELFNSGEVRFNGQPAQIGALRDFVKQEIGAHDDIPAMVKAQRDVSAGMTVQAMDEAKMGGAQRIMIMSTN